MIWAGFGSEHSLSAAGFREVRALPTIDTRRLAIWIGLGLIVPSASASEPSEAIIVAERLEVFDEPSETAYLTGVLPRGERIAVQAAERDGWLAIDPPPGSVCWIEGAALDDPETGPQARVGEEG